MSYQPEAMNIDTITQRKTLNPKKLVNQFIDMYYNTANILGWNKLSGLYLPTSLVIIQDNTIGNYHNMVCMFTEKYAKRAVYKNVRFKWAINKDTIILNTFGAIQFVSFFDTVTPFYSFTDTFILTVDSSGYLKISVHMMDY